jgi:hypothetical protein
MKIDASMMLRNILNKYNTNFVFMQFKNMIWILFVAAVNMYHHFCDFFNLYASLHVNSTKENPDQFTKNTRVLIWRTYPYHSSFEAAFRAFTTNPIIDLNKFKGKKVCFKNVIFPLLPRMIFGLYYNTPLVSPIFYFERLDILLYS